VQRSGTEIRYDMTLSIVRRITPIISRVTARPRRVIILRICVKIQVWKVLQTNLK